jgi:mannose-6-phosphate isomerase
MRTDRAAVTPEPTRGRGAAVALIVAATSLCVSLAACNLGPTYEVDAAWHRKALVEGHLAHWLAVAPTETGFLRTEFGRTWQPKGNAEVDLTAQSRLVYALASGYVVTGDPRYLAAARSGADFLLRSFRDPVHGGFLRSVAADGQVRDASKHTYGHAFAIFALAHAYRAVGDERYRAAAIEAWRTVDGHLRDPSGGFRPEAPRDFGPSSSRRTQNPVMHLFEATLALYEATGDDEARLAARTVGDFVVYRLLEGRPDGGAFIPEWYDEAWRPLDRDQGGYVDLGHQFEWAYLLAASEPLAISPLYAEVAERVLAYAIKLGYDETAGGAYSRVKGVEAIDRHKGWWQQAECLRALTYFAVAKGRADVGRRARQTLEFVRAEFVDPVNGGWYPAAKSVCATSGCEDEQPDPYHMTAMHRAALVLAAKKNGAPMGRPESH